MIIFFPSLICLALCVTCIWLLVKQRKLSKDHVFLNNKVHNFCNEIYEFIDCIPPEIITMIKELRKERREENAKHP